MFLGLAIMYFFSNLFSGFLEVPGGVLRPAKKPKKAGHLINFSYLDSILVTYTDLNVF